MLEGRALWTSLVAAAVGIAAAPPGLAQDDTERNVRVRLGERLMHEANLYRLPDGLDPADLLGPAARRDDRVAGTFVGLDGRWRHGGHEVDLDALVTAYRFDANEDLDNESGTADLAYRWRLGSRWSGEAGARRARTLASFANRTSLVRDLIDTAALHGALALDFGARWRATVSARDASTTHEAESRRGDDRELTAATARLDYETPRGNAVGVEVAREDALYATAAGAAGGTPSDYAQRAATVRLTYAPSAKVAFRGSAGRVERTYPHAAGRNYSGDVWNVALTWAPTDKTRFGLERWRDLRAHVDAESDHFVSTGTGLAAGWSPRDAITLALEVSREEQRYLGEAAAPVDASRFDTPRAAALTLTFAPLERVTVDVAYRRETRRSNRFRFDYDAEWVGVGFEIKL